MSRNDQPCYRRTNALVAGLAVGLLSVPVIASAAPQFTVLHSFTNGADGGMPEAAVIADASGALYGTTARGSDMTKVQGGAGIVYKLSPTSHADGTWPLTTLYSFTGGADGGFSQVGLVFDKASLLYGMTNFGGHNGYGNIFSLTPPKSELGVWVFTGLYQFFYDFGSYPQNESMIFDTHGSLYGTTQGDVFRLSRPTGSQTIWQFMPLYRFVDSGGYEAHGSVVFDRSGALYGTTLNGPGMAGAGTVYKLVPPLAAQPTWQESSILIFGRASDETYSPSSGLVIDGAGNLFGTAEGGASNDGAVYELSAPRAGKTSWTFKTIYSFAGSGSGANPNDGAGPTAPLVLGDDGSYYGMTAAGGSSEICPVSNNGNMSPIGCGTIYRLTPPAAGKTAWKESVLYRFAGGSGGAYPTTALLVKNGALYGTTPSGGKYGFGTVFKLVP